MCVQDRILKILEIKGLNKNSFSNAIGIQPQTLHHIVSGRRTNPSFEVIQKIVSTYSDINPMWLITGKGSIFIENDLLLNKKNVHLNVHPNIHPLPKKTVYSEPNITTLAAEPVADYKKPSIVQIPVVNIEAAAGSGYYDPYLNTSDQISLPANMISRSGLNLCIKIKGDSMSPTLLDSSYLIINNIHPSDWVNMPDEHVYVVSDREGRTYVKRIKNRLNKGFIVCMSDNVDKANYPNFNLQIDEINTIWHAEWYISAKMPNINENYYSKLIQLEDNFEDLKNDMKEILKQIKPKQ